MKLRRSTNIIYDSPRRRGRLPIVRIVLAVVVIAFLVWIWQRGGEQPQARVEKEIPAGRLGQ